MFRRERLNDEIDARLLTNEEAATLLGVPERTLRRWRAGDSTPQRAAIRRIAEVFDREPLWFAEVEREAA